MGIEGTAALATHTCAHKGPTELLRRSVVAIDFGSDMEDFTDLDISADDNNCDGDDEDALLAVEYRRRTSIPPTFAFGADTKLGSATGAAAEERRWRSFDCASSSAAQGSSKAASMELLASRIQLESEQVSKCCAKLGRGRFEWARAVKGMFRSSTRKEQVQLLQMQLVAEVAKGHRSLAILNDMKTLVMTMDDSDAESSRASFVSVVDDPNNQKLLDGIENADQVLAEDNLHHVLSRQSRWLQELIRLHADKKVGVARPHGVAPTVVMQQFLGEFVRHDGVHRVPCAFDMPTLALVRFEKMVVKYKFIKPALKHALDQVCHDTMASFARGNQLAASGADVFDDREARDVMQSLVREIVDAVAEEAWVSEPLRPVLRAFVEQMVFSRLACACYRSLSTELDELNAAWREQVAKARALGLHEVGLPVELPAEGAAEGGAALFAKTTQAFNNLPHLVPSCVLAAFLNAVRVLYREANLALGVSASCMSADVLLPLLVFVLSRCDLPHLHSQVYLVEEYAIEESQEGSEAAYYLACLKAAMGYIMTRDACK
ncbi:hypothetical protein PybrP1_010292 [[Pythium] brassicae (nom. inval.)]|nr:hypothetical protein PybrP1_010292 [[Pythium] brassicae (nom. inval.)]